MDKESLIILLIAASLIVNLVTMVFVIVSMGKNKQHPSIKANPSAQASSVNQSKPSAESGVVFCRNCGNQFDSKLTICPNCKTRR